MRRDRDLHRVIKGDVKVNCNKLMRREVAQSKEGKRSCNNPILHKRGCFIFRPVIYTVNMLFRKSAWLCVTEHGKGTLLCFLKLERRSVALKNTLLY